MDEPFGTSLLTEKICSPKVAEKLLLWSRDHKLINRIETVDDSETDTNPNLIGCYKNSIKIL